MVFLLFLSQNNSDRGVVEALLVGAMRPGIDTKNKEVSGGLHTFIDHSCSFSSNCDSVSSFALLYSYF